MPNIGDTNYETDLAAEEADVLRSIKTVSIDREVISIHDLKSIRDDQQAEERQQNFENGKLQRVSKSIDEYKRCRPACVPGRTVPFMRKHLAMASTDDNEIWIREATPNGMHEALYTVACYEYGEKPEIYWVMVCFSVIPSNPTFNRHSSRFPF